MCFTGELPHLVTRRLSCVDSFLLLPYSGWRSWATVSDGIKGSGKDALLQAPQHGKEVVQCLYRLSHAPLRDPRLKARRLVLAIQYHSQIGNPGSDHPA